MFMMSSVPQTAVRLRTPPTLRALDPETPLPTLPRTPRRQYQPELTPPLVLIRAVRMEGAGRLAAASERRTHRRACDRSSSARWDRSQQSRAVATAPFSLEKNIVFDAKCP